MTIIKYIVVLSATWIGTHLAESIPYVQAITDDWKGYWQIVPYLIIGLIVLFLYNLITQPVIMYDELGGFVENPFLLTIFPPKDGKSDENQWAMIRVGNLQN